MTSDPTEDLGAVAPSTTIWIRLKLWIQELVEEA